VPVADPLDQHDRADVGERPGVGLVERRLHGRMLHSGLGHAVLTLLWP
jgi:hypothetical protein